MKGILRHCDLRQVASGCALLLLFTLTGCDKPDAGLSEAELEQEMLQAMKETSLQRHPNGSMARFNQVKSVGCFDAVFSVPSSVPVELKRGLFSKPGSYPARIRFANASKFADNEKDLRGMSIKVSEVQGETIWGEARQQDFLLNSYPGLFAATPRDFLQFIRALRDDKLWWYFLNPKDLHLQSLMLLMKARSMPASLFDIRYWSTTPFQHGHSGETAVKYSVQPCSSTHSKMPDDPGKNYLQEAMVDHLQREPACFDFMLQLRSDPENMPIDDARTVWDEGSSPFVKVATITIPDQEFRSAKAMEQCEAMSFNPWQSLPEHTPLGSMNRVRKSLYADMLTFRREHQ